MEFIDSKDYIRHAYMCVRDSITRPSAYFEIPTRGCFMYVCLRMCVFGCFMYACLRMCVFVSEGGRGGRKERGEGTCVNAGGGT